MQAEALRKYNAQSLLAVIHRPHSQQLSMLCHRHLLLQGMTPLHLAAFDDFCKLGKLLLACGADRAAEDNEVCHLECHINAYTIAACKLQE